MKIRMIGCGAMGAAIAHRLTESGHTLSLYDKHFEKAKDLAKQIQATAISNPKEDFSSEQVLILSVKPENFAQIANDFKQIKDVLVISVLLGISKDQLKTAFPNCTVLRTMPNLAVQYGEGVIALACDPTLDAHKIKIEKLLSSLGALHWTPEEKFEAMTALTGSAPAFVCVMLEAMVDAAIEMGLSAELGLELAKKMLHGTVTTLNASSSHPSNFRWKVASPGGATSAGIRSLEKHGIRTALIEAFIASANRAKPNPSETSRRS
ncbi:MAG: Pyrroline-5-carboxylate reductase [Chlamydiales bacterium]|nr:Pyrroline-5-carboxylate reductase [Chlamydiales bacterium]